jgi:hypothetical protein
VAGCPLETVVVSDPPWPAPTLTEGAVPVPVSKTVCGLEVALSAMVKVPDSAPRIEGVNTSAIWQLAPAARVVPQLFV